MDAVSAASVTNLHSDLINQDGHSNSASSDGDEDPPDEANYGALSSRAGGRRDALGQQQQHPLRMRNGLQPLTRLWSKIRGRNHPQWSRLSASDDAEDAEFLPSTDRPPCQHPHPRAVKRWAASPADIVQTVSSLYRGVLLTFVPIGMVAYLTEMHPTLVFVTNALAIVPLSALLTDATERIASDVGDTVGALLNISLGNLVELILFIVALIHNEIRIVQASILGSILVNLMLILGSALLAGGLLNNELVHNTTETQLLASLLYVSVFAFLMPTAFDYTYKDEEGSDGAVLRMSRISALMVLGVYIMYFVHQLKYQQHHRHHPHSYPPSFTEDVESSSRRGHGMSEANPLMQSRSSLSLSGSLPPQPLMSRTIRFADEDVATEADVAEAGGGGGFSRTRGNPIELDAMSADDLGVSGHAHDSGEDSFGEDGNEEEEEDEGIGAGLPEAEARGRADAYLARQKASGIRAQSTSTHVSPYPHMLRGHRHSRSVSLTSLPSSRGSRGYPSRNVSRSSERGEHGRPGEGGSAGGGGVGGGGEGGSRERGPVRSALRTLRDILTGDFSHPPHPHPHHPSPSSRTISVVLLVSTSFLMSICAEFLVSMIEAVVSSGHLSESVIGLIILPIIGNIAEYVTVVSVACRDKMDLAIAVSLGSSIQIALCVTPLTVLSGWLLHRDMSLTFNFFEMATLLGTVLLVNFLILNGRTSGLKGGLMCACYVMIGLGAYLSPGGDRDS